MGIIQHYFSLKLSAQQLLCLLSVSWGPSINAAAVINEGTHERREPYTERGGYLDRWLTQSVADRNARSYPNNPISCNKTHTQELTFVRSTL